MKENLPDYMEGTYGTDRDEERYVGVIEKGCIARIITFAHYINNPDIPHIAGAYRVWAKDELEAFTRLQKRLKYIPAWHAFLVANPVLPRKDGIF